MHQIEAAAKLWKARNSVATLLLIMLLVVTLTHNLASGNRLPSQFNYKRYYYGNSGEASQCLAQEQRCSFWGKQCCGRMKCFNPTSKSICLTRHDQCLCMFTKRQSDFEGYNMG